ncbi:hypothetical protein GGR54DRAFT_646361 [Hypoxylon sp. NC1633]|nr:hypothetical protein GGR54DRAFT_646361 [Hypoxylon sp. NC1633]
MAAPEDFTLLAIAVLIIGLRIYVRWTQVGPSNWQLDDYLMPLIGLRRVLQIADTVAAAGLQVIFGIATTTAYIVGGVLCGLTNSHMSDELRAAIQPTSKEYLYRQVGSRVQVFLWSVYAFILWALKACVVVFYSRLTARLANLWLRVRFAYILLGTTYLAVALTILLSCQPISKFWQINPDPGNSCQPAVSRVYVFGVIVPNIFTDVYLLSIPLPLLWKANISWRRKVILITLFSGAVVSMITSIVRAHVILHAGKNVVTAGSAWACRETFVAITVTNLPILHPLFQRCAEKLGVRNVRLNPGRTVATGTGTGKRSHPLSSLSRNRRREENLPDPNAWTSEERILVQPSGHGHGTSTSATATATATAARNPNPNSIPSASAPATAPLPSSGIIVNQEIRITTEPAATAQRGRRLSVRGPDDEDDEARDRGRLTPLPSRPLEPWAVRAGDAAR